MTSQPTPDTCVLIAEVTGDAPLLGKLGAVETQRAVERCRNRAERSIDAYRGYIVQADGRTLIAHFPRGENAALAAFDLRARVKQLPPVSGVALSVQVAIHAGNLDAMSQQPADAVIADARKLVALAPADQVLVSSEGANAMPDNVRSQLSPEQVAGFAQQAYVFRPGHTPAAAPSVVEAFAPTSTSLALDQHAFDTAPHSQSPVFNQAATAPQRTSLMLRHNKNTLSVSDNQPVVLAGREEGNDLVIADRRASRHHARIEWRHNHFVLIDTSTNGTFMVDDAGNEVVLRRGEADLPLRGRIAFGYSPTEVGAEVVYFDIGLR
ncbi:FHA domain-containing protein [Uliginosibacterium aquaticum]|uniref:FHA domain-containing protein n=1 Tax=Uliginosibacterium aquaticum TaxID=2731212 RepID=A0ABX2IBA9_9RHOO|nr:FHA domain-containing protein [Uliginosibacterium aquaticum]NSL53705.1 FHA domain-containing protein [Uliginosibacterium aquaticum]